MAANKNERTLIPAIIPPGSAHIHAVTSAGFAAGDLRQLVAIAGFMSSLTLDFSVRVAPKSTISPTTVGRLPFRQPELIDSLVLRCLRLNAVSRAYSELWSACFSPSFGEDEWVGCRIATSTDLDDVGPSWTPATPLRLAIDRRQALVEIDALVALMLGLTGDELCTIYRTQFPVLYGYDRNRDHYDINGRLVPNSVLTIWRQKGARITRDERTATNQARNTYPYELQFVTLDREADMRRAYAGFERRLAERS